MLIKRDPWYLKILARESRKATITRIISGFFTILVIINATSITTIKEFKTFDDVYYWLITNSHLNSNIQAFNQVFTMGKLGFLDVADTSWKIGFIFSGLFKICIAAGLWRSFYQKYTKFFSEKKIIFVFTSSTVTFLSLVNPASLNLTFILLLYKFKKNNFKLLFWIISLLILFEIKNLQFIILLLFLGISLESLKFKITILFSHILLIFFFSMINGFEQFKIQLFNQFQIINGYSLMNSDSLEYLSHYLFYFIFCFSILKLYWAKLFKTQRLSVIILFFVLFKYGFTRHDVFHVVVSFSTLFVLSLFFAYNFEIKSKQKLTSTWLLVLFFVTLFFSLHGEDLYPPSKFGLQVVFFIFFFVMYCKKYFYKNVQLILVAALFISTIAASGATPKNPIMPTINKTNPIDISHRVRDVYYSILFTINKKNGEIQNSFLIEKAQIIKELTNKLRIKGNVLLLNYPVPIFDKSSNVNQIFPPVNPTTAFTGYLDQLNARWLASSKVDFVIFDGSNVSNGQLLNDSPEFFKVLVCNFEVLYMNNDFLVLKPRNLEVCNTYKETLLDFPSDLIKNDIDEKFVYFKDSNLNSFLKNIQRIVWKENSILKVNGSSFYFKNGPKGTLVKIPNSLDLPDRYSLNGNVRNSIYFNYASIFG